MARKRGIARTTRADRRRAGRTLDADSVVGEPQPLHEATVPDVAAIEENGLPQEATNPLEIWKAVLVPLGHEEHAVGPVEYSISVLVEHDAIAEQLTAALERHGVGGPDLGAAREEPLDDVECRGLAHVVGAGLEREAPDRKDFPVKVFSELTLRPVDQDSLLRPVDLQDGSNRAKVDAAAFAHVEQRGESFGKQDPPNPVPGNRNELPILESAPTPWRTCSAFAPTFSQSAAISFMNETRAASMAFDAYFVSSALAASMTRIRSSRRMNGA